MSPATNEPGSAVLCTLPHTPGAYIRKTPAGEDGGEAEPTGAFIVMVALAEVPRNAEGAQREGRVA